MKSLRGLAMCAFALSCVAFSSPSTGQIAAAMAAPVPPRCPAGGGHPPYCENPMPPIRPVESVAAALAAKTQHATPILIANVGRPPLPCGCGTPPPKPAL